MAKQPDKAPADTTRAPAPKSDRYRVRGPGGLFANGRSYVAGDELQLSEADALSVIDQLDQI